MGKREFYEAQASRQPHIFIAVKIYITHWLDMMANAYECAFVKQNCSKHGKPHRTQPRGPGGGLDLIQPHEYIHSTNNWIYAQVAASMFKKQQIKISLIKIICEMYQRFSLLLPIRWKWSNHFFLFISSSTKLWFVWMLNSFIRTMYVQQWQAHFHELLVNFNTKIDALKWTNDKQ